MIYPCVFVWYVISVSFLSPGEDVVEKKRRQTCARYEIFDSDDDSMHCEEKVCPDGALVTSQDEEAVMPSTSRMAMGASDPWFAR